jgi:hypothetical protein
MCKCKDCKGLTLLKGSDGRGIVSITNNEDGTFTFLYTDGTTYISPDLTGPQGDPGTDGNDGTNAYKFTRRFFIAEGGVVTIARSVLLGCSALPVGCFGLETFASLLDFHVQIWTNNAEIVSDIWTLDNTSFDVAVNNATGLITITRIAGSIDLYIRVVILA